MTRKVKREVKHEFWIKITFDFRKQKSSLKVAALGVCIQHLGLALIMIQ